MDSQPTQTAILIFVRGIPGSGKSYLTRHLANKLGNSTVVLDPDMVDTLAPSYIQLSKQLSAEGLDEAIHPFRWLRQQAVSAAQDRRTIIWNQPFTKRSIFDRLVQFIREGATEHGVQLRVVLLEVDTPPEVAYERIQERKNAGGHGPSKSVFDSRVEDYTTFAGDYETISIDGTKPINESIDKILSLL